MWMKGPVCPGSDGEMQLAVQGQQRPQEGGLGPWGCFSTLERGTAPGPQEAPSGGGRALSEDSPLLALGMGRCLMRRPRTSQLWPHRAPRGRLLQLLVGKAALEEGPQGQASTCPALTPVTLGRLPSTSTPPDSTHSQRVFLEPGCPSMPRAGQGRGKR